MIMIPAISESNCMFNTYTCRVKLVFSQVLLYKLNLYRVQVILGR